MYKSRFYASVSLIAAALLPALRERYIPEERPSGSKRRRYTTLHKTNGNREVSRRLRQEVRSLAKRAVEYVDIINFKGDVIRTEASTVWEQLCSDPTEYQNFRKASPEHLIEIRNNLQVDLGLSAA